MSAILADVYCDLRRKCASIRALEGERKGRVVSKPVFSVVRNVLFRVQPGGLARIRLKGVRQVCAFARGQAIEATESEVASIAIRGVRVHFNPYRSDHFHLDDGTPVRSGRPGHRPQDGLCRWPAL
jgi:hypothetical protein